MFMTMRFVKCILLTSIFVTAPPAFSGDHGFCPDAPPASIPKAVKNSDSGNADTVYVQIVISDTGYVCSARAVGGPKDLKKKAEDAVRTWKFKPGMKGGHPVPVLAMVRVQFSKTADGKISPKVQPSDSAKQ